MLTILRAALTQRIAVYTLVAVLCIAGLLAVNALPQSVYPNLDFSRVNVRAENGQLAPTLVQTGITRPLERELAAVPGVEQIVATSTQGAADVNVTFDPTVADTNVALQRIATAVSAIQSRLPSGTTVRAQQVGTNLFPIVSYGLSSNRLNLMQLREIAQYQIQPQLVGRRGIALVNVLAGDVREYRVVLSPQQLAARHVTIADVDDAISKTNTIDAVGYADSRYVRSTILASGIAHTPSDIAAIPLGARNGVPLTLGSVANVEEAPAPPSVRAGSRGENAVIINVFGQPGASFVSVARVANTAMEAALRDVPSIHANNFWDQSVLVSDAISNLRDAIIIGLVLSTIVLLLFLRNWRSTVIAGAVIPITIVITFGFMKLFGQGLNLMTLGGLAIGVGLVIDDAIVVVENIYRHLGENAQNRLAAIVNAVREISAPMISSTFTTIVVFAPLSLLSGIPGAFFRALSIALAVALVISLVLAFFLTPNLAADFVRTRPERSSRFIARINRYYTPALHRALSRPIPVLGGAALLLAATIFLATHLGSDFLPALDEGAFELTYTMPPGTALPETQRVTKQIERVVDSDPAVKTSATIIGASMTLINTDTPQGTSGGTLRATLYDEWRRPGVRTVMNRIGDAISSVAPNVQFSMRQLLADSLSDLSNQPAPIEIRVFGPQQSALIPIATNVAQRIQSIPGVSGTFSGVRYHSPSIVVRADPAASAFGITAQQFLIDERALFGGDVVTNVISGQLTIPVRVRYPLPLNPSPSDIAKVPYVAPDGSVEPLNRIATLANSPPQSDINELNGRQYLSVTAQISGSNLGDIVTAIKKTLAQMQLPLGYSFQIAGAYELQQQSFGQFALAIGLSVALVFLVMLLQFRSFFQPIAIVAAVPLAAFGAALLLFLTHISLNVSSLMGFILLVGLVVKNGILLLEYAARHQRRGQMLEEALVTAAQIRLRPIVMTTLTALLGMLPLAFAFGSGSEILRPLAVAVIGGLLFSTLLTLIVVPVLFSVISGARYQPPSSQTEIDEAMMPPTPTHA